MNPRELMKTPDAQFQQKKSLSSNNSKYDLNDEYKILTPELVVRLQHHIKLDDLRFEILNYNFE